MSFLTKIRLPDDSKPVISRDGTIVKHSRCKVSHIPQFVHSTFQWLSRELPPAEIYQKIFNLKPPSEGYHFELYPGIFKNNKYKKTIEVDQFSEYVRYFLFFEFDRR